MRVPLSVKERAEEVRPDGHAGVAMLPASEMCGKLDNLRDQLPHLDRKIYEFAALLSKRLRGEDTVSPRGFADAIERLITDLGTGFDGRTHEPVGSYLVGKPTGSLDKIASAITEAVCPPDFAAEAARIRKGIVDRGR
jgi:hypothetical protein